MSSEMKYYRTVFKYEVLSNEPLGHPGLEEIAYHCTEGHCSGMFLEIEVEVVSENEIGKLLIAQGSDPSFLIEEDEQR